MLKGGMPNGLLPHQQFMQMLQHRIYKYAAFVATGTEPSVGFMHSKNAALPTECCRATAAAIAPVTDAMLARAVACDADVSAVGCILSRAV